MEDQKIIEVTEKELEDVFKRDMKTLKRFLKENNVYNKIIRYLCPNGLKEKSLYYKVKHNIYVTDLYDFRSLFAIKNIVDPSYTDLGHQYWEEHISPISSKFIKYYTKIVSKEVLKYKVIC